MFFGSLGRLAEEFDFGPFLNRVGNQMVADYRRGHRYSGTCNRDAYARERRASKKVSSTPLRRWDNKSDFGRLWGSLIRNKERWEALPEEYRGMGAPGAMVWKGWGTLVDQTGIWSGNLMPGAVIQTWRVKADYERVKQGKKPNNYGHSFIFRKYVRRNNAIIGMKVADNRFHGNRTVVPSSYGFWVGANIYIP